MKQIIVAILFYFLLALSPSGAQPASVLPINLRCNFWASPQGIDVYSPDLSWTIQEEINRRDFRQTGYQILVATSIDKLQKNKGDLWNSGKVLSDKMAQISYAGKPLQSSQQVWWKVQVWDENGTASAWSKPSQWTMGILNNTDWKASWISAEGAEKFAPVVEPVKTDFVVHRHNRAAWITKLPKPEWPNFSSMLLRKEFTAKPKLLRAVVHVCGLGQYELTINGKKVGNDLLTPGWSDYSKTVLYDTYEVTPLINGGANAVGLLLSNGMYNIQPDTLRYVKFLNTYGQLKAIAQLRLEYADGSVALVGTDTSWQVSPGPVTYMNQFGGEDYDAQLEPSGWNKPRFKTGNGCSSAITMELPGVQLKGLSASAPPVKAIEKLAPVKSVMIKRGVWVYDLGQNASIMPEILVQGKRGASVRIIPAELVNADGTVDRRSATQDGVRPAWWQYTLATTKQERWFPKFFYQGARYLQVELRPAPGDTALPVVEKIAGMVVHTAADSIGKFACSNDLFNRIYSLVRWAQRSNLMSVITDCPHREKMPWLEQYHLNGPSLRYNYDLLTLFTKAMNDMADAQLANGFVPNIAPEFFHAGADWEKNGFRNSPEWGSSFIIVPWQQYLFSSDVSLVRRYYPAMKRYLAFLDSMSSDGLLNFGLGDWYDMGPKEPWGSQLTPVPFTASAIYFYDYQLMAKMAGVLGEKEDAARFNQKAVAIREAFNKKFYQPEKGIYASGSNTTYAMPLFLQLAAPEARKQLADSLVADIRRKGNSFTSGDVGYRFLLKALAMTGYSEVIYDMNNQSEKPGYGYQLKMGATSLTEKWDAGVGNFGSQNHFMLGQINEWFFNDLLGIGPDENGPGFKKMIINPSVVGELRWAKGSYQTVSGLVSVDWKREGKTFSLDVVIPANTSATIYLPTQGVEDVTESGVPVLKAAGIQFKKVENGKAVYEVGSGHYRFVSTL